MAERYNEPERFTALIGYEWTSNNSGNNLHRVVVFRPEDREPALSLRPVADRLAELTGADVTLASEVVGEQVRAFAENLNSGDILVLENVRYEPGETNNDPRLAAQPEDDEKITPRTFTLKQVDVMIRSGRLRDAKSIAGLLYYMRYGARGTR